MSKIHISPTMIAIIADNCKTVQELQELIKLVQKTAHPYQISWIQAKIEKMKHEQVKE